MTDTVTIRDKWFYPYVPETPYQPAIEPCEEFPDGVPEVLYIPAREPYWDVDCIVETWNGTRVGHECAYVPEDATDEQIAAYILNAYALLYTPPENA